MLFVPEAMSIFSLGNLASQHGDGTIMRLKGRTWIKCGYRLRNPG